MTSSDPPRSIRSSQPSALAQLRPQGWRGVIVSADKDLTQLVGEHDRVWDFARNQRYGVEGVVERMGVRPDQVAALFATMVTEAG